MAEELKPPKSEGHEMEDPGAHGPNLDSSDESEQFTDASEGHKSVPSRSGGASPIPIMRVEKVDEEPAYGDVPGTAAYKMRAADAVPDEVEIVPDGQRSRSQSRVNLGDVPSPDGPRKMPSVPSLVVEKIDPEEKHYGDVPGTAAFEMRKADAEPDEIIKSPVQAPSPDPWNEPTGTQSRSPPFPTISSQALNDASEEYDPDNDGDEAEDEGFGDDFDDFEEGEAADDDFGDFDDGFATTPTPQAPAPHPPPPQPAHSFPLPDYSTLSSREDIQTMAEPYLRTLFPSSTEKSSGDLPKPTTQIFLTERSHSLYSQLVAPPPLAPPDWLRSRIRRLFLVSLGVPVDLDEILPASKQKKLILPSIHGTENADSSRPTAPANGAVTRLKSGNESSASIDSKGHRRRRKEDIPPPTLDISEALRVGGTTEVKMRGMSDEELKAHVAHLETLVRTADEVLVHWRNKREGAMREKEAFEGVIENLVKHARKVRK